MQMLLRGMKELWRYPSAIVGMFIIVLLVGVSLYAVIAIPYSEALRLWRGGEEATRYNPENAPPAWIDLFTSQRLARTIATRSQEEGTRTESPVGEGMSRVEIVLPFNYEYDTFPTDLILYARFAPPAELEELVRPRYSLEWRFPDGTAFSVVENRRMRVSDTYRISQDGMLRGRLPGRVAPHVGLLADINLLPDPAGRVPMKGAYEAVVSAELPEGSTFEIELVVHGQVHGLFGTDSRRRDITVAILWGAPLALVFGILATIGASVSTFVLAGIGTWFGGWVDALFQKVTQVNIILPFLAILIMVGQLYSRSLWVMLGLIVLFNIFSAAMITYRAMFMTAKTAPFIEAAKAYGAGNFRIIFRYLLPKMVPILLPGFVLAIPTFVFLEASLAVIGLGDPVLPTWGKLIFDARITGALYKGFYYQMVQPAVLLMFTGLGFALVGFSLDRVFNPRLRSV